MCDCWTNFVAAFCFLLIQSLLSKHTVLAISENCDEKEPRYCLSNSEFSASRRDLANTSGLLVGTYYHGLGCLCLPFLGLKSAFPWSAEMGHTPDCSFIRSKQWQCNAPACGIVLTRSKRPRESATMLSNLFPILICMKRILLVLRPP